MTNHPIRDNGQIAILYYISEWSQVRYKATSQGGQPAMQNRDSRKPLECQEFLSEDLWRSVAERDDGMLGKGWEGVRKEFQGV